MLLVHTIQNATDMMIDLDVLVLVHVCATHGFGPLQLVGNQIEHKRTSEQRIALQSSSKIRGLAGDENKDQKLTVGGRGTRPGGQQAVGV